MRRLTSARHDRGAAALIVAIVLPVLLLGLGAIVVDVGTWYVARGQDQNGADAAAVAVGRTCAAGRCVPSTAGRYVQATSNGYFNGGYIVCGASSTGASAATGGLDSCSSKGITEGDNKACPAQPSGNYVDVYATPKDSAGTRTIRSFFGKGSQGVAACAQAQWGPAGFGGGVAITISYCDWNNYTVNGARFAPPPPYPPYPSSPFAETVLQLKGVTDTSCPHGPSGGTPIPGGFGRLLPNGSDPCTTSVNATGWYDAAPGNGNAGGWLNQCPNVIQSDYQNQTVVEIPIFDGFRATGSNGQYHLNNMAAFVITAYFIQNGNLVGWSRVPGSPYIAANYRGSNQLCGGNTCLIGYFVAATDPNLPPGTGGLNGGVSVPPKLTG